MLRRIWDTAYLSDDGRARHIAQQVFIHALAVVFVLTFGLLRPGEISAGLIWVGGVLLAIGTIAVAVVPWRQLPKAVSAVVPLLDMIGIGALRLGLPPDGTAIVYLTFLAAVWLTISHRMKGVYLAVLGSALFVALPAYLAPMSVLSSAGVNSRYDLPVLLRYFMLPLVIGVVALMLEGLHSRLLGAMARDHELTDQLEQERNQARQSARRLQAIGQSLGVGVLVLDKAGNDLMHNRMKDSMDLLIRGQDGKGDFVHHADGVTRLRDEERPSALAMAGETYDGKIIVIGEPGTRQRMLSVNARPVIGQDDTADGAVLVLSDITDMREAIRVREEFLAKAAHELRTPLTSIIGYLDLLAEELEDDDRVNMALAREYLNTAISNGDQLMTLVQDLLLAQQSTVGRLNLLPKRARVGELVDETLVSLQPQAEARGISLTGALCPTPVMVVDRARLRQVFDNLVSNAVKYTPSGGEVSVTARTTEVAVEVSVVDNGVGLSQEDVDRLFVPFFRAGGSQTGVVGSGLGLTVAKSLVEAHGGFISVDSTLGEGTTVRVTLPFTSLAEAE